MRYISHSTSHTSLLTGPLPPLSPQISIAPVYIPSEDEVKTPATYAANVRLAMGKLIGAPEECDFDASDAREFYKKVDGNTKKVIR